MADPSYGHKDKSQWRVMLQRRLSTKLRNALVMASDIPSDYHGFVAYLREKDAVFQEIQASQSPLAPWRPTTQPAKPFIPRNIAPANKELTVSQGGSAMDLDAISKEKDIDGRLTNQAKNARRALGRCLWCNKTGHLVSSCPRGVRTLAASTIEPSTPEDLKEELQQ